MQENKNFDEMLSDESVQAITSDELLPKLDELIALIDEKRYTEFVRIISEVPTADIAELLDEVEEAYRPRFFRLLPKEIASEVFVDIGSDAQEDIIAGFNDRELASMLEELYLDDTVDIIEEMPASVVKRIIRNSTHENRSMINQLLHYPKDSAGTIMTTEYVRFRADMTVREALDHIRSVAIDKETIYTCYVTDPYRRLLGIVTAKDLLISSLDTDLSDIMEESVIYVNTTDDKEYVAGKFEKYGFLALPVVDAEQRLVGIITVDDAIDVIKEEAEEDFAKMAGITPTETPYLKTDVFSIWKSRIPWLLILMISSTISSAILTGFESALPAVLVLFVPMIMGTGGNSGGQSSVTVTRSISLGEVEFPDIFRVFWKELRIGVMCAVTLGVVTFFKVWLIDGLLLSNDAVTLTVSLTVALSLALTIIVAKIIGATLPLLAKKIGLDPAVMASPLITTLVDAISLVVYFFVAGSVLNI